jgi:hypothetical protein
MAKNRRRSNNKWEKYILIAEGVARIVIFIHDKMKKKDKESGESKNQDSQEHARHKKTA